VPVIFGVGLDAGNSLDGPRDASEIADDRRIVHRRQEREVHVAAARPFGFKGIGN
jgi:hypothetical protein